MAEEIDISKLLRLKRHEQPPPGYFEGFIHEFHRRQRRELMKRPAWETMWERILSIAPNFRVPQLAYAAIAVLTVSLSTLILTRPATAPLMASARPQESAPAFSLTSSKPVTISESIPVSARTVGALPSHYVLESRPVSNEQPLSF